MCKSESDEVSMCVRRDNEYALRVERKRERDCKNVCRCVNMYVFV